MTSTTSTLCQNCGATLLPDELGNPNRVIGVTYAPVPEPAALLGLCAAVAVGFGRQRVRAQKDHNGT